MNSVIHLKKYTAVCSHLRAIELYANSVVRETLAIIAYRVYLYPAFVSVQCSRLAEFNFLIDKIKIGELQCEKSDDMTVKMGYLATSAIPEGNYYLATNSEYFFSLGDDGIEPYLEGNAISEGNRFQ